MSSCALQAHLCPLFCTHQILTQFSCLSYYKVTFTKSLIQDIRILNPIKQPLQVPSLFAESLAASNIDPSLVKLKRELQHTLYPNLSSHGLADWQLSKCWSSLKYCTYSDPSINSQYLRSSTYLCKTCI